MPCPKCLGNNIIEFFPVFTEDMRNDLEAQGMSASQIQYYIEIWENKQLPTGGFCLTCRSDWTNETIKPEYVAESYSY